MWVGNKKKEKKMNTARKNHFEIGTLINYIIGASIISAPLILAQYCSGIINIAHF